MKFESMKSFFGKRLITVLLVPAILTCNFTAIHASADETIAAMAEAESEESSQENAEETPEENTEENHEEQSDDSAQDQGEESQDNSEGGDNYEESDESSDSGEGSEEGENSEGEDASSTGASTEEGDNTDSGEGASTGASSDNSGSDSSTDATSADSADASSSASSDDSADASSSASSEEAADAASSASSDEEWEDEDVSENSEGDVSENDSEDEEEEDEIAFTSEEDVFENFELSIVYYFDGSNVTTKVCFPRDCIKDRDFSLKGVSGEGKVHSLFTIGRINSSYEEEGSYYIYTFEGFVKSSDVYVVAHKILSYANYGHNRVTYEFRDKVKKLEDYSPYPSLEELDFGDEPEEVQEDEEGGEGGTTDETYDNTQLFYINPSQLKSDYLTYSISYMNHSDDACVFSQFDGEDGWGESLSVDYIENMKTGEVVSNAFGELPEGMMPLTPLKVVYAIKPRDTGSINAHLMARPGGPSTHCKIIANTDGNTSMNIVNIDGVYPVTDVVKAAEEKNDDNLTLTAGNTIVINTEGTCLTARATDDHIKDIEYITYNFRGNRKDCIDQRYDFSADQKSSVRNVEGNTKQITANIGFSEPGEYIITNVKGKDYAENESIDENFSTVKVLYAPNAPVLSLDSLHPEPMIEDGEKIYEFGTEVTMQVKISGGIIFTDDRFVEMVKSCIKAKCDVECGNSGKAYDYDVTDVSYANGVNSATIHFRGTGKYVVSVSSGNVTDDCGTAIICDGVSGDTFTIEPEVPNAAKKTVQKSAPKNGFYYNEAVIESVVFDRKNIEKYIYIENIEAGLPTKTPKLEFETAGKQTIAKAVMDEDGRYCFKICYRRRKHSKVVEMEFDTYVIDRKAPFVSFTEVENFSANNGKVAPVINCTDENMDKKVTSIRVIGSNNGEVQLKNSVSESMDGIIISCADFARDKKTDDLYTLEATVMDLAGNETKETLVFSVNRFGSVFVLGEDTKAMNEQYYTNDPTDVTITEINVDDLVTRDVSVTRDGSLRKLNSETDYRVNRQGDNTSWKTYTYNVDRLNFDKDGVYSVTLYTKDRATNEMDNKSRDAEIEFAVDKTAPSIVVADIEEHGIYKEESHSFNVDVTDNMGIVSFTVYNNGKAVDSFTGKELEADGNVETITLKESKEPQNITLIAKDIAGNKQTLVFTDVMISTKEIKTAETPTSSKPSTTPATAEQPITVTGTNDQENNDTENATTGISGEIDKKEFPYKKVGAVAMALACVAAAGGAGFMIRRRKQKKA
ncbi:hypothetical protein [Butyrivibrio sp. MC2021]|uniref:hypothetical protein n=1 Tax=Butyrivibrio sp. MC2021 TaxID=1408306 RepID=UPI0004787C17|nr:hypothetical protein [Butyrivibrio sp. MC2021]